MLVQANLSVHHSQLGSLLIAVLNVLFTVVSLLLIDKFGRKVVLKLSPPKKSANLYI